MLWDYGLFVQYIVRKFVFAYPVNSMNGSTNGQDRYQVQIEVMERANMQTKFIQSKHKLLCLLNLRHSSLGRLRIKPHDYKSEEPSNNRPKPRNPDPTATNSPAAWVLIVGEVADSNFMLFLNIGEEWPLVVNAKGEDTVLIWNSEARAIYSAVLCAAGRGEG